MNHYLFEDLKLGQIEGYSVKVTEDMLESFKSITGDINPLHTDEQFAAGHGFSGRVCYGMLTASLLSTLAGVYLPGERSLIQSAEIKFVKPVFIGDELKVSGVVDELNDTVQQIVLKVEIRNQKDEKVLRGKMKVGLLNE